MLIIIVINESLNEVIIYFIVGIIEVEIIIDIISFSCTVSLVARLKI